VAIFFKVEQKLVTTSNRHAVNHGQHEYLHQARYSVLKWSIRQVYR